MLPMNGNVVAIYAARTAEAPMQALAEAHLEAGRGIVGDRYYVGTGTFSLVGRPDQEVTLIESEQIDSFNRLTGLSLTYDGARRNVVTRGVQLNELVGVRFQVGQAILEGMRLCEPCAHLARLVSPEVLPGLVQRGGLRARVVDGGTIKPSDAIGPPVV